MAKENRLVAKRGVLTSPVGKSALLRINVKGVMSLSKVNLLVAKRPDQYKK